MKKEYPSAKEAWVKTSIGISKGYESLKPITSSGIRIFCQVLFMLFVGFLFPVIFLVAYMTPKKVENVSDKSQV